MNSKFARLGCIVICCGASAVTRGNPMDGIELISQSYQVTAAWHATFPSADGQPPSLVYDGGYNLATSDGLPLSASTAPPLGYLSANSGVGTLTLHDYSFCGSGGTFFMGGRVQTFAQGIWDFRPTGTSLDASLSIAAFYSHYGSFGGLTVTLIDETVPATLLNLVNPISFANSDASGYNGVNNYTFAVDPGHVYELAISGHSDSFDRDSTQIDITALISSTTPVTGADPVPETSSAMVTALLLLPLAIHGVRFRRARRIAL